MEEKLLQYFSKFRVLTPDEKSVITKDIKIQKFSKKHTLLKEGLVAVDNYFVIEGCVRQYYLKDGNEHTTSFYTEEDWVLPAIGHIPHKPSTFYLECIEECTLVVANEEEGSELMRTNSKFVELSQLILEKEIMRQQEHFANYLNSTPLERYRNLVEKRPSLIQSVSQILLSSDIGVKPESLSRIKNRISKSQESKTQ